jgi:hypothetical protein
MEKTENPIKRIAVALAHQMDDEKRLREEFLPPWKEEEIRICGRELRDEIWKKGFNIETVLYLSEQYKTLGFAEYKEWMYS